MAYYHYDSVYCYVNWLSSALIVYLIETMPDFYLTYQPLLHTSPIVNVELLLQPHTYHPRYFISDEVLLGFAQSQYYLMSDPSILDNAYHYVMFGQDIMMGGGQEYLLIKPHQIKELFETSREKVLNMYAKKRRDKDVAQLVVNMVINEYKKLYAHTDPVLLGGAAGGEGQMLEVLPPKTVQMYRSVCDRVWCVPLYADLYRYFSIKYFRDDTSAYDKVMYEFFNGDIIAIIDGVMQARERSDDRIFDDKMYLDMLKSGFLMYAGIVGLDNMNYMSRVYDGNKGWEAATKRQQEVAESEGSTSTSTSTSTSSESSESSESSIVTLSSGTSELGPNIPYGGNYW